jgi:hypothetical protein
MKGLKVNMDMVNCGLLCVVLVLVVMCCVKRERFLPMGSEGRWVSPPTPQKNKYTQTNNTSVLNGPPPTWGGPTNKKGFGNQLNSYPQHTTAATPIDLSRIKKIYQPSSLF